MPRDVDVLVEIDDEIDDADTALEMRFRAQTQMLDRRFGELDARMARVDKELSFIRSHLAGLRDGLGILLRKSSR